MAWGGRGGPGRLGGHLHAPVLKAQPPLGLRMLPTSAVQQAARCPPLSAPGRLPRTPACLHGEGQQGGRLEQAAALALGINRWLPPMHLLPAGEQCSLAARLTQVEELEWLLVVQQRLQAVAQGGKL